MKKIIFKLLKNKKFNLDLRVLQVNYKTLLSYGKTITIQYIKQKDMGYYWIVGIKESNVCHKAHSFLDSLFCYMTLLKYEQEIFYNTPDLGYYNPILLTKNTEIQNYHREIFYRAFNINRNINQELFNKSRLGNINKIKSVNDLCFN